MMYKNMVMKSLTFECFIEDPNINGNFLICAYPSWFW